MKVSQTCSKNSKEEVIPAGLRTILTKNDKRGDTKRQKKKDLNLLAAINCEKVNI